MHTAGRRGESNILHRLSTVSWIHLIPAGFPSGIPGIGEEIEGAMQQAPHPSLHSDLLLSSLFMVTCTFLLHCGKCQEIQIIPRAVKMRLEEEIDISKILNRHPVLDCKG